LQPVFCIWGAAIMKSIAVAVVFAGVMLAAGGADAAPFCKTLKGESVGFGEPAAKKEAEEALDKEITTWAERYQVAAKAKGRKVACQVYIEALNEFACTAEASVCREPAAPAKKKP
jgi:hypothetical protein